MPVEAYDVYRAALAIPPPPTSCLRSVTVLCLADEVPPEALARQVASVRGQVHGWWRLRVLGSEAGGSRPGIERSARLDGRIAWVPIEGAPAAAELGVAAEQEGPVLLLARGAVLDPNALGWFALAFDLAEAEAFVCDEDVDGDADGRSDRRAPTFRQIVDPRHARRAQRLRARRSWWRPTRCARG